ncbi:unnamed protein product [Amoebophrya sp. A120]|nr:unnamed protein product [Amoebophrya sp. A120]|eukprot:GSA120T00006193001.1
MALMRMRITSLPVFANLHHNSGVGTFLLRIGQDADPALPEKKLGHHLINCKSVWVWKNASLLCLSHMILKFVMHITQEPHFAVMQKRSLSCRLGNTSKLKSLSC